MMRLNPKLILLLSLLVAFGLSFVMTPRLMNAYYLDVILGIGINIILAVSLNLINGYTGQFSLGHGGFVAVGAYSAASVTTFLGPSILVAFDPMKSSIGEPSLFLLALIAAGIASSITGFAVGVPSLRLKGDYLAIVTLGFGEIIRVIFQNIEAVGRSSGMKGIPNYTSFFWTFAFAIITVY